MIKTYTTIAAAVALTAGSANAATTLITTDPTTYTDATTSEGNWHYQSLTLNDAGFTQSGDAADLNTVANVTLNSVTFAHDDAGSTTVHMVILTDVTDFSTAVAQSTNGVDQSTLDGGDLMTWNFNSSLLSTSTEYFLAFYQDTNATAGTIESDDTVTTARFAFNASTIAGGIRNAQTGGISSTGDAMMNINITAVPEPSSTALLGLGGLALILRRRK